MIAALFNGVSRTALAALLALSLSTASASAATPELMAFGDSLTAGYGVAPEAAFPVKRAAHL